MAASDGKASDVKILTIVVVRGVETRVVEVMEAATEVVMR